MGRIINNTVRVQLTDSSQLLSAIVDTALGVSVDWDEVVSATITCETNDCRVAFGTAATATVGHVLAADQSLRIPSNSLVRTARVINKTAGSNAIIQVTLEG
jgi:hypothetical protein